MPRHVVTAPGFPHGTARGWDARCGCHECLNADRRRRYTSLELARLHGQPHPNDLIDATPAREHLHRLAAAEPYASVKLLADVMGLSHDTLTSIADGQPVIRRANATRVLAVTVEQVSAARAFLPAAPYIDKVRQLGAAGWPVTWLSTQTGIALQRVVAGKRAKVTADVARCIDSLADQIGYKLATPANTGLPARSIELARRHARSLGYYPPGCYNDDGTLDPRACPDHPFSLLDDKAADRLDQLRAILAGESHLEIAARRRIPAKNLDRLVIYTGIANKSPNRETNLARVAAALDAYDHDGGDPVYLALSVGALGKSRAIPLDAREHPGYRAWAKEQTAAVAALGTAA